ncbi:tyrosine-type recombinase/integrase [Afipia carboxidovorans]|nr:site-specific integrase [Afipia carboxidovorans]
MLTHKLAQMSLNNMSGAIVARYRDDRLKHVQSASVRRELIILRHVFEVAIREWAIPLAKNPCSQLRFPQDARARERRLLGYEEKQLFDAIGPRTACYMRALLTLLVETGMRRGELLSICWNDVDLVNRTVRILNTKNGHPRRIPLTPVATSTLAALTRASDDRRVFPLSSNAVRLAWERLRKRASLPDLRLHDLRHEAVSRFFEYGLSVPEVALISGHRELKMLSRYTHLQPERIANKLAQISQLDASHVA